MWHGWNPFMEKWNLCCSSLSTPLCLSREQLSHGIVDPMFRKQYENTWRLERVPFFISSHCGVPWWRHQMETFSALLDICAGNSPVPGEFPTQRPVTRSFDVYFDLRPDKRLSKQSWGWWFETLLHSLWRHRNAKVPTTHISLIYMNRAITLQANSISMD